MADQRPGRTAADSQHFDHFARWIEHFVGSPVTFSLAVGIVVVWAISGPVFAWSDTWQLVINTGTTIVTFLMVFLIQNTQSRDTRALQLKLDELIRVNSRARNSLLTLEEMSEAEIATVKATFDRLNTVNDAMSDSRSESLPDVAPDDADAAAPRKISRNQPV
ncbi:MAG TPA: low affinity iron permease family protein [Stellaceae bacterium]|jgi:low affinity Fe/Cu permease|nr:low affinity iron permease family protein [Stellaceae bacterium]